MILIVDNYDSFTYNLVHLVAAVAGEMPHVIRNDQPLPNRSFDRVIISPGPGRPDNARDFGISMDLIRRAEMPVLGVCLGHQGIACAFGGHISRTEPMHGRLSEIHHAGDPLFTGLPPTFTSVRYHSLLVAQPLPLVLRKIAWTADGSVMALRHAHLPLWGVQFHPESILSEFGAEIVANFLRM